MTPSKRERVEKCRLALAALKADLLRGGDILQKSGGAAPERFHPVLGKLQPWPAAKDWPNSLNPDQSLADGVRDVDEAEAYPSPVKGVETKTFRMPRELCNMSIHTCRGQINVPAHGVIHTAASHEDLHAELRGRGAKEMRPLNEMGKAADGADPVSAFRPDRLRPIVPSFARGVS